MLETSNLLKMMPRKPLILSTITLVSILGCLLLLFMLPQRGSNSDSSSVDHFDHRRLQFEGMFETPQAQKMRRKKAREAREARDAEKGSGPGRRKKRPEALTKAVEDVLLNMDRYNLWWTGPPESDTFKPAPWGAMHTESNNAIFTVALVQGQVSRLPSHPLPRLLT